MAMPHGWVYTGLGDLDFYISSYLSIKFDFFAYLPSQNVKMDEMITQKEVTLAKQ